MVMLVMLLSACVASLSAGLALLGLTEQMIAATHVRGIQVAYAADAAAHLAIGAIAQAPDSPLWPSTGNVATLGGGALAMPVATGEVVDLVARTAELNREAGRRWPLGADTPRWRLAGWGALLSAPPSAHRVAIWVADDVMDGDGISDQDSNGVLMMRIEAFGSHGAAHVVVLHVRRVAGAVQTLTWKEE